MKAGGETVTFHVEVASSYEQRSIGLMNIKQLPDDVGMAFVFEHSGKRSFFMKDTLIPLDIAFWDEQGQIVEILTMEPCTEEPCRTYDASASFIGAVEVKKGILAARGIQLGDMAKLLLVS